MYLHRVYQAAKHKRVAQPYVMNLISAGKPTPTCDDSVELLDLNEHLIRHEEDTYFIRVSGDSMVDEGIFPGDLLIVDRSLIPKPGDIIIIDIDGELAIKKLDIKHGYLRLVSGNLKHKPIIPRPDQELKVWGVVTNSVRYF
jgi:DNA polymerase V